MQSNMAEADSTEWTFVKGRRRGVGPLHARMSTSSAVVDSGSNAGGTAHWTTSMLTDALQQHITGMVQLRGLMQNVLVSLKQWLQTVACSACAECQRRDPQVVCLGLGCICDASASASPSKQLAFLLLLRHLIAHIHRKRASDMPVSSELHELPCLSATTAGAEGQDQCCKHVRVCAADPAFHERDHKILEKLGIEFCSREAAGSWQHRVARAGCTEGTGGCPGPGLLLFMPHCPSQLLSQVIWHLWPRSDAGAVTPLSSTCIMANSMQTFVASACDNATPAVKASGGAGHRRKRHQASQACPDDATADPLAVACARDASNCILHLQRQLRHGSPAWQLSEVSLDPSLSSMGSDDEALRHTFGPALSTTSAHFFVQGADDTASASGSLAELLGPAPPPQLDAPHG